MRLTPLLALAATTLPALADFSYTSTSKTGGAMAAMSGRGGAPTVNHFYYKGQKMKFETGTSTMILDLDARTITTLNTAAKTYTVRSIDEAAKVGGDAPAVKIDVKETGQKKTVNGFMASELLMTMEMEPPPGRAGMGKMQMEMDLWISPDVPGASEMRDFHKRNADKFPWSAIAGGGNPSMAKAVADMQREMMKLNGVPVQQVIRVRSAGATGMPAGMPAMPQMTSAQTAQMSQARAQLEAMIAKGGPGADMAKQALAHMPGGAPAAGGAAPSSSGAMIEITMDSSDFSGGSIPESAFSIPGDFKKAAN